MIWFTGLGLDGDQCCGGPAARNEELMAHGQTQKPGSASQNEVIEFLSRPGSYGLPGGKVDRMETHGALVFLAGDEAYKIKRQVKLPYFDFSTLAKRQEACRHEIEVNKAQAPQIYYDVVPINRDVSGKLTIGGPGKPIEWAVHMRRFSQDRLLGAIARKGVLSVKLVSALAETVAAAHRSAPVIESAGYEYIAKVVRQVATALPVKPDVFSAEIANDLTEKLERALGKNRHLLLHRARLGCVRRCHGDMHLDNVVLIGDKPILFDAIEFDDRMASIDRLYDLAFLLMDIIHVGQRNAANLLLNRYLHLMRCEADYSGLSALPLFLACRAAVRAIVMADRNSASVQRNSAVIDAYVKQAHESVMPPPVRLIAIGGYSGTGKSTLASSIAPSLGASPGAVHLRSDTERKALFGVPDTQRLDSGCYTRESAREVYDTLMRKARRVLAAGHSVVVDAVFAMPEERAEVEAIAQRLHVEFSGIWLNAPAEQLASRVNERIGDASDATADVVYHQLERGAGDVQWRIINASGEKEAVHAQAMADLELLDALNGRPAGQHCG